MAGPGHGAGLTGPSDDPTVGRWLAQIDRLAVVGPTLRGEPGQVARLDPINRCERSGGAAYQRSLVYSGLVGLAISMTGLVMVVLRRRRW